MSTTPDNPLPAYLVALAERYLIPTYQRLPVAFTRGLGPYLFDSAGRQYLDFLGGIGVANVGHCHPRVVAAAKEQLSRLLHASNLVYNEPQLALAERLAQCTLEGKVFFANSGAEATEAALKLARRWRPEGEVVVLERAFHGRTLGALSATPQPAKQDPFAPLLPGIKVARPEPEALAAAVNERTAAILLEPVQGEGGVWPLGEELLQAARQAADRVDALLIYDEVQCGMGRCGHLWAYQHYGIAPDALTAAKGLGGGLPIGVLIAGKRCADLLRPSDHGSTFGGNPVVCAASLAALEVVLEPALLERVRTLGARLKEGLKTLPRVGEVRGLGLMVAAELELDAHAVVRQALLEERLLVNAVRPRTLRLLPPLVIGERELEEALERLGRVLGRLGASRPQRLA